LRVGIATKKKPSQVFAMIATATIAATTTKMLGITKLTRAIAGSKKIMRTKTKNINWTSHNQQRKALNFRADIDRTRTQTYYLELIIAGLLGASVVLALLIGHQIYFAGL
jgi:hypothetical protein